MPEIRYQRAKNIFHEYCVQVISKLGERGANKGIKTNKIFQDETAISHEGVVLIGPLMVALSNEEDAKRDFCMLKISFLAIPMDDLSPLNYEEPRFLVMEVGPIGYSHRNDVMLDRIAREARDQMVKDGIISEK